MSGIDNIETAMKMRASELDIVSKLHTLERSDGAKFSCEEQKGDILLLKSEDNKKGFVQRGSTFSGSMWIGEPREKPDCIGEYNLNHKGNNFDIIPYRDGLKFPDEAYQMNPVDYLAERLVPLRG